MNYSHFSQDFSEKEMDEYAKVSHIFDDVTIHFLTLRV